jgi:ABC-type uncharacterized transport system permease subunit
MPSWWIEISFLVLPIIPIIVCQFEISFVISTWIRHRFELDEFVVMLMFWISADSVNVVSALKSKQNLTFPKSDSFRDLKIQNYCSVLMNSNRINLSLHSDRLHLLIFFLIIAYAFVLHRRVEFWIIINSTGFGHCIVSSTYIKTTFCTDACGHSSQTCWYSGTSVRKGKWAINLAG